MTGDTGAPTTHHGDITIHTGHIPAGGGGERDLSIAVRYLIWYEARQESGFEVPCVQHKPQFHNQGPF